MKDTAAAAEDTPRVRTSHVSWGIGPAWFDARILAVVAGLSILFLFGALLLILRDKPLPRYGTEMLTVAEVNEKISTAQDRLKENPQDLTALVDLGLLLFQKGKDSYVEAISDLEEARDLGAIDERIFYCLGVMYQEEGLYPYALTEFQRFLRHYPEDKEVRLLAAKLSYRMGLYQDAVSQYERLKFTNPNDALIEENYGLSLWRLKAPERAVVSFEQLRAYGGDSARRAEVYLGEIAIERENYESAAASFARSDPAHPLPGIEPERIAADVAVAAAKLGHWDDAKAAWEEVLKATPKDSKANSGLREAKRRIAAAKRAEKKAAKAAPKTGE